MVLFNKKAGKEEVKKEAKVEHIEKSQLSSDIKLTEESKSRLMEPIENKSKTYTKSLQKKIPTAQGDSNKPIMKIQNVNKIFKTGGGEVQVLHEINFDIMPGSFNIIFGPSGSGKTTILNTLLGLEKPTNGQVSFYGQDLYTLGQDEMSQFRAHRYGVIYQTSNWVESLNCAENVALPLLFLGIDEKEAYGKAMENLEIVGMSQFATRDPKTLSGGQQQRISLARSLINNPWLIIADEPTGNLDSKAGNDVMKILYDLCRNLKRTIVLVTHNLDYVILANQMIYLKDGHLSTREEALPKPIKIEVASGELST